jgi:hypothetical protein
VRNIQLPYFFAENLRALACRVVALPVNKYGVKETAVVAPLFGTYDDNRTDYTFVTSTDQVYFDTPTDQDSPSFRQSDLYYNNGESGSGYIAPAGIHLDNAIQLWNAWIQQFTSAMSLQSFTAAGTNNALTALTVSRVVIPPAETSPPGPTSPVKGLTKAQRSKSKEDCVRFDYSKVKTLKVGAQPRTYTQTLAQQEVLISYNQPVQTELHDLFMKWVVPKYYSNGDIKEDWLQGPMCAYEPHNIFSQNSSENQGAGYPTLSGHWQAGATVATKQPTGSDSSIITALKGADSAGEGGFLGQILADFAAQTFNIPMLSHIGSIIPF